MEKTNGNDNAFSVNEQSGNPEIWNTYPGLTKREYFAAMAMQGFCANSDWAKSLTANEWNNYKERISDGAVEIADALIAALNT